MIDPFLGMIAIFGFDFAPRGWATCSGQLLAIVQNQALFALLGTQYGGNGTTTFALPDLRGRTPVGVGTGAGLTPYAVGETRGTSTVSLTTGNMPAHNHPVMAVSETGDSATPENAFWSNTGSADREYKAAPSGGSIVAMNGQMLGFNGGGQPVSIMQPYVTVNYCIALQGIFPSRQ
ncbi:tail fiber protein [Niabella terrae]